MSENMHPAVATMATLLAPIRERAEAYASPTGTPGRHAPQDRKRLLAALDAVEDIAKYLDTLAPGDQHYGNLFRAAMVEALKATK
jgi:hypothetical protein